jgi:hypothetical protein
MSLAGVFTYPMLTKNGKESMQIHDTLHPRGALESVANTRTRIIQTLDSNLSPFEPIERDRMHRATGYTGEKLISLLCLRH